jgi:hypothetical protein
MTTVIGQVLDENDNAPAVVEPVERTVSVRERQPAATPVLQILATDPDAGDNASLQYAFSTGAFATKLCNENSTYIFLFWE